MPSLPVIQDESQWLRLYRRALSVWCGHVADEKAIGSAAVYANGAIAGVVEANCILGELAHADEPAMTQYFQSAHTAPLAWYLPAGDAVVDDMADAPVGIWHLERVSHGFSQTHPELTIIPARASFAHVCEIAHAMRPDCPSAAAEEAAMLHLDDPRVDAVLALQNKRAVGFASILSTNEAGFIMEYFIHPQCAMRGYETALTGRVLDICARSLFRDVYWPIDSQDCEGQRYAAEIGFVQAGAAARRCRA